MRLRVRNRILWRGGGFKIGFRSEITVSDHSYISKMDARFTVLSGRKIRDRIAKLQERVIANEMRAAAALNGWDQQFTPSPLTSTFHASHHDHNQNHNMGFLKSSMPMDTDPTTPFVASFNLSPASSWSSDVTVPLSPTFMLGDSPCFTDGSSGFSDTISTAIPGSVPQGQIDMHPLMDNMLDTNILQDISATENLFPSERLNTPGNQPVCYATTGMPSMDVPLGGPNGKTSN